MAPSLNGYGSIPFGEAQIQYRFVNIVEPYLIVSLNPAKTVHGHNLHLLPSTECISVLENAIYHVAHYFNSPRLEHPGNWNVVGFELSENRHIEEPEGLAYRLAKLAPDQTASRTFTRYGSNTVCLGPKCREVKLYAKGPEFRRKYGKKFPQHIEDAKGILRFEIAFDKKGTEKLLGDRSLGSLLKFLSGDEPKTQLDEAWKVLPVAPASELDSLAIQLIASHTPAQVRSILGYHFLSASVGKSRASKILGMTRQTKHTYDQVIAQSTIPARN